MAPQQKMFTIMAMTGSQASAFHMPTMPSMPDFWANGTVNVDICGTSAGGAAGGGAVKCTPGHCVDPDGNCVRDPRVPEECHVWVDPENSCYPWSSCSGDNTECDLVSNDCTCSIGYCKDEAGACVASDPPTCQKGTPGTCGFLSCSASRGPTDCLSSVCFCTEGFCWSNDLQTCTSASEAALVLAGTDDEVALIAARRDHLYPLRALGVRAKHFCLHFATAGVFLLVAGLAAQIAVATTRRRGTTISAEPLLAGA